MKVKACPYCETTINKNESDKITDFCPECGKEINLNELLSLDIKETLSYVKPTNTFAAVLKVLGWVTIVLGFICAFILKPFGIAYCVGGLISGVMILGFSEIINLLHQINMKIK